MKKQSLLLKQNKNKELLDKILSEIKRIAKELNVETYEVPQSVFMDMSDITEWQLKKFKGRYTGILRTYFPYPDKALARIKEQKNIDSYVNSLENKLGEKLLTEEYIEEIIGKIKPVIIKPYAPIKNKKLKRANNVVLSDLHIGSDINEKETGYLNFGKLEESRRLARITKEVIEYKVEKREETELNVLLLGDIIQNSLHDARDGAPLTEQFARAVHLLSQMIAQFSNNYPKVNIYCNPGNHGRDLARHKGRAVNQKWDSVETKIYYALKVACKSLKNTTINIPLTPYVSYDVFDQKIFATHGDGTLNVGYPGKGVKVDNLEKQINRINAALDDKKEYKAFIVGHLHIGSVTHLGNGATLLTNGAIVPSDEYAISIGMLENTCGQYIFESVPGFVIGDTRFIKVSSKDDKDKSLDKIINPWKSF